MLKRLAVITSVFVCSLTPTQAISMPYLSEELYKQENAIFSNLSHDIYGITKSIWRKLGIDSEIDDGSESIFREYGVFFLLFGGLFGWMVYMSLSDLKR
ncbi:hypothetical protein [Hydrococcus rivularis]|nr:hypothetical protein [Hydrococcus rivularis]